MAVHVANCLIYTNLLKFDGDSNSNCFRGFQSQKFERVPGTYKFLFKPTTVCPSPLGQDFELLFTGDKLGVSATKSCHFVAFV